MIILDEKHAIKSDASQWMLCKPRKPNKASPNEWESYKYFHSLAALVDYLVGERLRTSDYHSLKDLTANLVEIKAFVDDKLKGL